MRRTLTLILTLGFLWVAAPAYADTPQVVWVSPTGSDANTGLSRGVPLKTLQAANDRLCAMVFPQPCNTGLGKTVEVRLEPGTYVNSSTEWTYSDPVYGTYFVPAEWVEGWTDADLAAHGGYPTFDGTQATYWGFRTINSPKHLWFYYLKWYRYISGAITQVGGSDTYIYENVFQKFGTYYRTSTDQTFAGVFFNGVIDSYIRANTFQDILNDGTAYGHEHGAYIINSDNLSITRNLFQNVGGDPIRLRNGSRFNVVTNNIIKSSGQHGYIGDWYCQSAPCTYGTEQPSWSNTFRNNALWSKHPWATGGWAERYCYDVKKTCSSKRISA